MQKKTQQKKTQTKTNKIQQPIMLQQYFNETQLSRDANIKESRLLMYILNNSDILFRFVQISVCKCILRGINTSYFGFFLQIIVNKKHGKQKPKKVEYTKSIFSRHNIVCRFEIIDGFKYVYCIKHAYKFLLREQVGFVPVL